MMWVVAILVLAAFILLVLKYQHFHVRISNFIVLVVMMFLFLSLGYVYVTKSPNLSNLDGVVAFLKTYLTWVGAVFGNTGKVVGYAVNQDWKPALNFSAVPSP